MGPRKRPNPSECNDAVSRLYPHINEKRTPLPRYFSREDKCDHLGLSTDCLTVTYRGLGTDKNHKDAGSVRTVCPIPPGVGIYYFEIYIVSKGRDGYMGIGISPQSQNNLNRLPGWDKDSYGYHGDDGNSFCSKGSGQSYGPTFTTGDTVGCGVNFVQRTCFFTKNGTNLGAVVNDLPLKPYFPTVGLQTPGEKIEANFGQKPFVFDVSDLKLELRYTINRAVSSRPVNTSQLHSIVSSYLIHRGYSKTAQSFAKHTDVPVSDGMQSIENRKLLEKLIMEGKITEALRVTEVLYPNLLTENSKLQFHMKCRQFVELVCGSEDAIEEATATGTTDSSNGDLNGTAQQEIDSVRDCGDDNQVNGEARHSSSGECSGTGRVLSNGTEMGSAPNGDSRQRAMTETSLVQSLGDEFDVSSEMDLDSNSSHSNAHQEMNESSNLSSEDARIMQAIFLGRKLRSLADDVIAAGDCNTENMEKHLLEVFGLLAYQKPGEVALKEALKPSDRESVRNMLNGAILHSHNMSTDPQLQTLLTQSAACLQEMTALGIPEAAFIGISDIFN